MISSDCWEVSKTSSWWIPKVARLNSCEIKHHQDAEVPENMSIWQKLVEIRKGVPSHLITNRRTDFLRSSCHLAGGFATSCVFTYFQLRLSSSVPPLVVSTYQVKINILQDSNIRHNYVFAVIVVGWTWQSTIIVILMCHNRNEIIWIIVSEGVFRNFRHLY